MSILSRVVGLVSRNAETDGSSAPHFAVMSPLNERAGEQKIVVKLFENGLSAYHLRRPHWTPGRCCAWIESIPAKWRSRIVLHRFPQLVRKYNLAGYHLPLDGSLPNCAGISGKLSAQCDDLQALVCAGKHCRRLMLGPVFPPEKYDVTVPRRTLGEYAAIAAYWRKNGGNADVLAFGGINAGNIHLCREAGFAGAVVVGAIWNASDPVKAFKNLIRKW